MEINGYDYTQLTATAWNAICIFIFICHQVNFELSIDFMSEFVTILINLITVNRKKIRPTSRQILNFFRVLLK